MLLKLSTNPSEDRPIADSIVKALTSRVTKTIQIAKSVNNERAIAAALKIQQNMNQV